MLGGTRGAYKFEVGGCKRCRTDSVRRRRELIGKKISSLKQATQVKGADTQLRGKVNLLEVADLLKQADTLINETALVEEVDDLSAVIIEDRMTKALDVSIIDTVLELILVGQECLEDMNKEKEIEVNLEFF